MEEHGGGSFQPRGRFGSSAAGGGAAIPCSDWSRAAVWAGSSTAEPCDWSARYGLNVLVGGACDAGVAFT